MKIAVVGGGIGGLSFALALHQRGLACDVYESVPEVKPIGVGITLLPHAVKELAALGVQEQLEQAAIENLESVFYNRFGQFIYREPRGRHAGYRFPELGIHRGQLHRILYEAVLDRLGPSRVHVGHRCTGFEQDGRTVNLRFARAGHTESSIVRADVVVACDGVNSAIRRQLYPHDKLCFAGINTWRGVTVHKPVLTGKSYMRIGSIETGKMVIYPIVDNVDGQGNQLINWVAEIRRPDAAMNDWNRPGEPKDFLHYFEDWQFPWLDVPDLITTAQQIFEYPMVDKDALPRWTFDRVTLMGDAAHPMYPRGSNGSAQAIIDARTLADEIAGTADPLQALVNYESKRLAPTAKIVQTNRTLPPDYINTKVDELSDGKPFDNIDNLISQEELRKISDHYKAIAGFAQRE